MQPCRRQKALPSGNLLPNQCPRGDSGRAVRQWPRLRPGGRLTQPPGAVRSIPVARVARGDLRLGLGHALERALGLADGLVRLLLRLLLDRPGVDREGGHGERHLGKLCTSTQLVSRLEAVRGEAIAWPYPIIIASLIPKPSPAACAEPHARKVHQQLSICAAFLRSTAQDDEHVTLSARHVVVTPCLS